MGKYDHLLDLSRPADRDHPPMSLHNRAAQFAPFDALTGFGGRIYEVSRLTGKRILITEEVKQVINDQLHLLETHIKEQPTITVTYFVPDLTKDGGSYETITAAVHKIIPNDERLVLEDDIYIAFDDILELDGEIFELHS